METSEGLVDPERVVDAAGPELAVSMRGIVKRFGGSMANDHIDLDVALGEVHALLGENGAGKSTLMNILYGLIRPDEGHISVNGRPVDLHSTQDAIAMGIGMVHQHFMLVPTLTATENVALGDRGGFRLGRRELDDLAARLEDLAERYGMQVPMRAYAWQLSVGEQQRLEILRALHRSAGVLILDEPTASLTPSEVEQLLPKLRSMAADGTSVIIITHHLDEVMTHADRITVLRRGRRVVTLQPGETDKKELARLMVGREVTLDAALAPVATPHEGNAGSAGTVRPSTAGLEVEGLSATGERGTLALDDVSFDVRTGEIVAIAGVEGNGQAELEEVLFGLRRATRGSVALMGGEITGLSPQELLQRGLALVPSDRYRRGLIRQLSVAENLVIDRIDRPPFASRFKLRPKAIVTRAAELIQRFSIAVRGPGEAAASLSGGNAQRVVLARVLGPDVEVLIAAQPTRGLDVGAIEFVWQKLRERRERNTAVLLISTDLDEVLALADRCHVMYRGRLIAGWSRPAFDREEIGLAMGGVSGDPSASPFS